jgi:hypothetical protein
MARISSKKSQKRVALLAALTVALILVLALSLKDHNSSSTPTHISAIPSQQTTPKTSDSNSSKHPSSTESDPRSDKSTAPTVSASGLLDPTGSFVSNHKPTNSSPQEQSVCNTTPRATCFIKFVSGGTVKLLAAQTTDSNGSSYWTWDINSAGLSPGFWQVTAVASLDGQTKSTTDSINLEVQ